MQLNGILSAVATPFGPTDEIDENTLRNLVERTIRADIHGLVACGSTGEFGRLSTAERHHVAETVIDQAAGRVPVVVHTGALGTSDAVALTRHADGAGAAGVLAIAPFYEHLSLAEATSYYRAIADSADLPVMIYNLPLNTGVNFTPEDIAEIAAAATNISYVKDTSGDYSQVLRLIHDYSDVVSTLVGWDTLLLSAFLEGAAGTICGAANIIPAELVSVYEAVQSGDVELAKSRWNAIYPVLRFLVSGGYNTGVKGALDVLGASIGTPRAPIAALAGARRSELEAILAAAKISVDQVDLTAGAPR